MRLFDLFRRHVEDQTEVPSIETPDEYLERIYLEYRENLTSNKELEDWQRVWG